MSHAQLGGRQIGKGFLYGLATIPSELNTCTYTTGGMIETWCNLVEWGVSQLVHVGDKQVFKGFEMPVCKEVKALPYEPTTTGKPRGLNLKHHKLQSFSVQASSIQ